MSCVLENCLLPDKRIGKLSKPLAALVVHYDSMDSSHCDTAHSCSREIPVRVLVSSSNFRTLEAKYQRIPGAKDNITVEPLYLRESHLNTERIKRLMAFGDENDQPPLYLQVSTCRLDIHVCLIAWSDPFDDSKEDGFGIPRSIQLQLFDFQDET